MFTTPLLSRKKYLFNLKIQQAAAASLEKVEGGNIGGTQALRTESDRNVLADKEEPVWLSTQQATQRPEGWPPQRHQDVRPAR